ncbi:MAG: polymer-forming cytoskeletal protein [Acidobacteria bacterium]|nr:polymer-forming cytoskeletal protein [Acidobacteriota bacterium]
MIFKSEGGSSDLNGFLDAGSHVEGDLRFENTFRIDGKLTGRIVSNGTLIVGEAGQMVGDVQAGQVFISGRVEGTIEAQQRVQIEATGKVLADIETPSLIIVDGAVFEGRCSMSGHLKNIKDKPAGPKAMAKAVPFPKDH